MPDAALAPARVCPECGKDPRAGSPRPPWWCSWTGLPLWLALALLGAAAVTAVVSPGRFTQVIGIGGSGRRAAGLTVEQVRAAAAGEAGLGVRVADAVLAAAAVDDWTDATCRLRASAISGPGTRSVMFRIGWPVGWLTLHRGSEYADLGSLRGPTPYASRQGRQFFWSGATATALLQWSGSASSWSAQVSVGGLALVLGVGTCLMIVAVRVARGRGRAGRGTLFAVLGVVLIASALWVQRGEQVRPRPALAGLPALYSGVLLADARLMAGTAEGRAKLAAAVADELPGGPGDAEVHVEWAFPGLYNVRGVSFGWPGAWFGVSTRSGQLPLEPRQEFAERRLRWVSSSVQWRVTDSAGGTRTMALNLGNIALTLVMTLGVSGLLVCVSRLRRGRRLRRYTREGRCFWCGYEVGWAGPGVAGATESSGQ